ncbi:sigma-70 family RNA polymerase sigma factor [Brevifollis gellanilyticus]|nr:sigma-70 family RNA polymerase sigma factor [Brevifollis gellanilyticus]
MSLATDIADGFSGPTDAELLHQMSCGDEAALGVFYERHATLLFSIAIKVVGDIQEAEEVLQDGLRTIWERAAVYNPSLGQPLSWAVVITRHKAIDRLRAWKRRSDGMERLAQEALTDLPADPSGAASSHPCEGAVTRLHGALATLPRDQTAAIELAFFNGMSQTEVATHLGIPLGTVKARIRRGMITLRDALEDQL